MCIRDRVGGSLDRHTEPETLLPPRRAVHHIAGEQWSGQPEHSRPAGQHLSLIHISAANVNGLTATADEDAGTVTLTGPDTATVQKGADALVAAGFFGKSSDATIKLNAETGAKNQKVQSIRIKGLHLCCGKCVKTVNEVLGTVPGVTGNTACLLYTSRCV